MNWNNTPTFRQRKTGKSKQHLVLLLVVWLVGLAVDVVDIVVVFAVMVVVLVAITGGAVVVFGAVALTDLKQVATFPTASTTTSSKSCEQQEAL